MAVKKEVIIKLGDSLATQVATMEEFVRQFIDLLEGLDVIKFESKKPPKIKSAEPKPMHPLAEIWNRHRGPLAEVRGCSGTRLEQADSRWSENTSTEYWSEVVMRIAKSSFCCGGSTTGDHKGWKADFDFLVRPNTHFRVLEGKYDDRKPPIGTPPNFNSHKTIIPELR